MTTEKGRRAFARLRIATAAGALAALAVFGGPATSSPGRTHATEVRVVTLPIANGFPLDLGIKKGFFAQQGIEIKKTTLQSGNDVVLALANGNGDIGYLGFVPMFIAVTSGIPLTLACGERGRRAPRRSDNWQNILVKGSSSIQHARRPRREDDRRQRAEGRRRSDDQGGDGEEGHQPDAFRLTALPFPQMRARSTTARSTRSGPQSRSCPRALNLDNDRIVMAPGPCSGSYWPIGGYAARTAGRRATPPSTRSSGPRSTSR